MLLETLDSHPGPAPGLSAPPPCRAVWLRPTGQTLVTTPCGAESTRYAGPIVGTWGGRSDGQGHVRTDAAGFHAELKLSAGQAFNATLTGGGHRRDWLGIDVPGAADGSPQPLDVLLSLEGELECRAKSPGRWGTDPGGSAYVGTEDGSGRPLALRLRLDPQNTGAVSGQARHRIVLPNGRWSPLVMRFATRIHTSLDQAMC